MITRRTLLAAAAPAIALSACSSMGGKLAAAPGIIHRYRAPRLARDLDNAVVYRREDEFCAWTYTRGFWEDGNGHLMQNFDALTVDYKDPDFINHNNIFANSKGTKQVTVRSTDRGRTWNGANPEINLLATKRTAQTFVQSGPINYLDRNVLVSSFSSGFGTPQGRAPIQVSKDNGRSWSAPSELPMDGLVSLTALNSYLVRPDGRCLLFMFEVAPDGNRRPLVFGSLDGGTEFHFMSYITPEHDPLRAADSLQKASSLAFSGHRWFYPRGVMLKNGRILCALRCQRSPEGDMWSEMYHSDDGGRSWGFLSRVNDFGAPASPVVMDDGRIVMVYGYRTANYGVRAAVSEDGGATWGDELIIRDDGGSWDLGYPNAWQAGKNQVGVIYYFNSKNDPVQVNGGKRHIARSIFSI